MMQTPEYLFLIDFGTLNLNPTTSISTDFYNKINNRQNSLLYMGIALKKTIEFLFIPRKPIWLIWLKCPKIY